MDKTELIVAIRLFEIRLFSVFPSEHYGENCKGSGKIRALHHDILRDLEVLRSEVPDSADSAFYEHISSGLRLIGRHGNNCNRDPVASYVLVYTLQRLDCEMPDIPADFLTSNNLFAPNQISSNISEHSFVSGLSSIS